MSISGKRRQPDQDAEFRDDYMDEFLEEEEADDKSADKRRRRRRVKITKKMEELARFITQTDGGEYEDNLKDLVEQTQVNVMLGGALDGHNLFEREADYTYTGPDGMILYQMQRYRHRYIPNVKRFIAKRPLSMQKTPAEVERWWFGQGPVKVIYRWHEIAKRPNETVYVCEGEKDADRLANKLGLLATTVAGQNWSEEAAEALRGRDLIVLQDNDAVGRENAETAVEKLAGLAKSVRVVKLPGLAHKGDVSDWLDAGHTKDDLVTACEQAPAIGALPVFNVIDLDDEEVPRQQWAVENLVPLSHVTLLSGEGAAGKSLLQLQLSAAHALGRDWIGRSVIRRPAMFIDAEDDRGVIHKRLADVLRHYDAKFAELEDLHLFSLFDTDAVMASFAPKSGRVEPTALYHTLVERVGDIKPVMIGIASSANVFAGNEIDRSQVQQFISLLTRLATIANGAVVLISHPSLSGIQSDSGLSGSTAWHNAVRARMFLKGLGEKETKAETPANDRRVMEFRKNNYGPVAEKIVVRYQNGVFVPVVGTTADRAERDQLAEDVYLETLLLLTSQKQDLSTSKQAKNYAVTMIYNHPSVARHDFVREELEQAQQRLLDADKIHIAEEGPASKRRKYFRAGSAPM